ncbi:MAG: DUF1801 domain-containing protein [Clostridia bacterium]|nr:DUF1801 domain-containing protein [Clostridia bacterium]
MLNPIDEYIKDFPEEIQVKLHEIRDIIREVLPEETTEKISWQMPTFYLNGNLVHFAGFKNHIGFFPGSEGIEKFKDKFGGLQFSKGGVQFNYDKPLPKKLIQEIVEYRVKQNIK